MTLFERTYKKPSREYPDPKELAKEEFSRKYSYYVSEISEDGGETICPRSLIMLLDYLESRITEVECLNHKIESLEDEIRELRWKS